MDTPKKYIRTLEGDMEAVKEGIIPNLSPFKSPPTATPTPKPEPTPPTPPVPEAEPLKPSPIKTYSGDFLQRMKDTHASTATVLAAEQDASTSGVPQDQPEKSPKSNIIYIVVGAILILLGIAGSYIAYTSYLTNVEPIILAPSVSAPIFVDDKEKISGTNPKEILQAIEQSVTRSLAPNTVRLLYTDFATGSTSSPQATTDNSVFSSLKLPAPSALLRNVDASRSMVGVVNAGSNQSLFFILSVASYSDTFAGMLSWERSMSRDLNAIFPPYPEEVSTATSTPAVISAPVPVFRDEVVNNHDTRVYYDAEGRSVLLYGYWNQTTLVIARDRSAFTEIIGRLATTRAQ